MNPDEYNIRKQLSFGAYRGAAEYFNNRPDMIPDYLNSGFIPTSLKEILFEVDSTEQESKKFCGSYIHLFNYVDPTNKEVLEVGCGMGRGCNFIKNHYNTKSIVGSDINDDLLNVARRWFPSIQFVNADAVSLQSLNTLFDIVITVETLLYWDCHKDSFKSFASALREGGSLLIASDMRNTDTTLDRNFNNVGLKLVNERNINPNVLLSLFQPSYNRDLTKIKMFQTKYTCVSKHYVKQ